MTDPTLITKIDKEDHDRLIRVDQKLSDLIIKVDKISELVQAQPAVCARQIKYCNDNFVRNKIFYWILPFIIAGLIAANGVAWQVKAEVDAHKIKQEVIEELEGGQ